MNDETTLATARGTNSALCALPLRAQDSGAEAQDLTNPLASLITLPIKLNYDRKLGPGDDGERLQTNVLPTATDSKLGGKKWGAGPAGVARK